MLRSLLVLSWLGWMGRGVGSRDELLSGEWEWRLPLLGVSSVLKTEFFTLPDEMDEEAEEDESTCAM